ncbi:MULTISPECIES: DUF2237 family protein [unclassified Marinobacterium]|jgi:uncharacterized protein|uniref:DUF2237 family protein n=1 Tax=unclassified Marinobacterium TaxID=2644139 RepID=UPI00156A0B71|nr:MULTISPECIES: DUF2237 domain-containing protein [unclassified Marinobacterium]NRP10188.1 hypothetical protein [Marinobacterium sp. xm-g-48]NRP15559.1 hypothetical protein [Marinobacterium sp. xm-a-152]NRP37078.1 hypothetical protein [Marinobacterium sp. xm-d-579]NRP53247.1 hypothetical protein [Marinobacterium sp. xm-v-242]NRP57402.1 hypothetical protein [Marinobacterium sp. xm-d-510]
MNNQQLNVLGTPLETCSSDPLTGYYRDGCCNTDEYDRGTHTVCAVMTEEFLLFSLRKGNDLITARPEYQFPGLKPGDSWCLCAQRWEEAEVSGCAPRVNLSATNAKTLEIISFETLKRYSIDLH